MYRSENSSMDVYHGPTTPDMAENIDYSQEAQSQTVHFLMRENGPRAFMLVKNKAEMSTKCRLCILRQ